MAIDALKKVQTRRAPGHTLGHWMPKDRSYIKAWLDTKLKHLDANSDAPLDPTLVALKNFVDANPSLTQLSKEMFTQVPSYRPYDEDPTGASQVRDFDTMLGLVNIIIKEGPQWFDKVDPPTAMGLIGFPINAILDWPMGTVAGYHFFLHAGVNEKWHDILATWGTFLANKASQSCLSEDSGWLSANALNILSAKGNDGITDYTFDQLYNCDKSQPYYGFSSWDAFFTRTFREGKRPIDFPDDQPEAADEPIHNSVIVNACESGPLQYVEDVQLHNTFWLKGQPYSLANMLNSDIHTEQFVGGSVYQAFLSALSYHRWHAPVSGTVVSTAVVAGTYYSENLYQGFYNDNPSPDPSAANNSQPYISAVATRGIIFIQADNAEIGLMAIVFIGMAEVSSCDFTVKEGDRITKGQEIGMFHFGGSSHCMVFRPATKLKFVVAPPWNGDAANNRVNSTLALVV